MLQAVDNSARVICRARDTGRVDCVSLASLLALYDTDMGNLILEDIARLYEVLEWDRLQEILIACGPGIWGAADLEDFGSSDLSEFAEQLVTQPPDSILHICLELQ